MGISDEEKARRAFIVANATASSALEGIHPDETMKALNERYINGDFSDVEELGVVTRSYLRKKHNLPPNAVDSLALLAVDNIYPSKEGLALFAAIERGEMTVEEAKEVVKQRARQYGGSSKQV